MLITSRTRYTSPGSYSRLTIARSYTRNGSSCATGKEAPRSQLENAKPHEEAWDAGRTSTAIIIIKKKKPEAGLSLPGYKAPGNVGAQKISRARLCSCRSCAAQRGAEASR